MKRIVLVVFLSIAALAASTTMSTASQVFLQRSADGALVHSSSGFVFPIEVGSFLRDRVTQYDQAGDDVSVGYNNVSVDSPVAATVYVYPARGGSLTGEFANRQSEVTQFHPDAKLVATSSVVIAPSQVTAMVASYAFTDVFAGVSQPLRSELLVAQFGEKFVEYRFTYPAAVEQACHNAVNAFEQKFAWP